MSSKSRVRIDHLLAAIMLGAMACIAFINVLSRFFFHFSIASTEELTINLFVWLTVVGTGLAFERGGQLGMVTLYNYMPRPVQKGVVILSASLALLLFILVDVYMIQAIYDEITLFQASSAGLGIPVWIYYAGVPVLSIFVFRGILRDVRNRLRTLTQDVT